MSADVHSVLTLTEAAARQVQEMLAKKEDSVGRHLRVYIEPGGCSGMQYGLDFDTRREGDLEGGNFGVTVLVDPVSANYLSGSVVDFSDSLNAGGFKITNPKARQSCGCGQSFEA
ncbi:MAG: HesB/IscA family protein [Limisphaerales bacterium]